MSQPDQIPAIRLRAIQVSGPDAIAFMQSQLTLDVAGINDSQLHPTAWCSPNGRADVVLLIGVTDDTVNLVMPEPLVAPTLKRARMFSIGREVLLNDDIAVFPADPESTGGQCGLPLAYDSGRSLRVEAVEGGSGALSDTLSPEWLSADIECGMPWTMPETASAYLPQMLGLEALGGLSYKKGCFPGQEVIARVHYRGRVKRRTAKFRLAASAPPPPGQAFSVADKPAQVLYAVTEPGTAGSVIGLAVVAAETEDNASISIGTAAGALL